MNLKHIIMNSSKPLPWVYYGIFLDEKSRKSLLERASRLVSIPDDWKIFCDHLTVVFNDHKNKEVNDMWVEFCETHMRETIELTVTSIGITSEAIAFGIDFQTNNKHSHITVACAPGVPPVRSNYINDWMDLHGEEIFKIHGTFGVVRPK